MADIPIEKKQRGLSGWIGLILAAAVLALLIWLFAGNDSERTGPVAGAGLGDNSASPGQAATTGPITDLNMLLNGNDEVVGREVRLTNVPAGMVPADAGFWITGDDGKREYVILHEVRTPDTPIEGKIDVKDGDRLDIVGTVRSADEGVPEGAAIPGPTAPLPDGVKHYIDAQSVTKTK